MEPGSSMRNVHVRYKDRDSLMKAWESITEENLESVTIKQGDTVTGTYEELIFGNPALRVDTEPDGTLSVFWGIREKTDMEKLTDRLMNAEKEK